MPDREKVIKRLEEISDYFFSVYHCSKGREEINKAKDRCDAVEDALALLKEQEPMMVLSQRECETLPNHYERKGFCPKCHQVVEWLLNRSYCGFCGQAVKWE